MDIWTIINLVTATVTLASAIAAVTPTKADDHFVEKWLKPIVNALALNVGAAKK